VKVTSRGLLLDVRPLVESRPFRAWWLGTALSVFGGQFTSFALLYYVWSTTHDAGLVGGVALAQAVPTVLAALVGGALADRRDRRRLVLYTRSGQFLASVALATVVIEATAPIALLYVLVGIEAGFGAAGAPANRSFTARLLGSQRLTAGLALSRMADQVSLLTGPVIAGLITTVWGVQVCFVIDALTFLAAMYGVARLPVMNPDRKLTRPDVRGLRGALRFVVTTPVIVGVFATDIASTVLAMPIALFPVVNEQVYGGSAVTLGLFAPAIGLGGIVAGALSGRVTASRRPGRLMLVSAAIWGGSLTCFGLAHVLWMALVFLAVAGVADTVSVVSRVSIVQHATPDSLRGRVNALDYLVGVSGPQVGNFRGGLLASATSGARSAVLGGLSCLVSIAAISAFASTVRGYDPEEAVVQR
jgi:MFS family permease